MRKLPDQYENPFDVLLYKFQIFNAICKKWKLLMEYNLI